MLLIAVQASALDHPYTYLADGNTVPDIETNSIVDVISPNTVVIAINQTIASGSLIARQYGVIVYGLGVSIIFYNPNDDKTYSYDYTLMSDYPLMGSSNYQPIGTFRSYPTDPAIYGSLRYQYDYVCNRTNPAYAGNTCSTIDEIFNSATTLTGSPTTLSTILGQLPYRSSAFTNMSSQQLTSKTLVTSTASAYDRLNELAAKKFPFTVMSTFIDWLDMFSADPEPPKMTLKIGEDIEHEIADFDKIDPLVKFVRYMLGVYLFLVTLHSARSMFMGVEH